MRKNIVTGLVYVLGVLSAIPAIGQKFYSRAEDDVHFPASGQELGVFDLTNCTNRIICSDIIGSASTLIPWGDIFYLKGSNNLWKIFDTVSCLNTSIITVPKLPAFDLTEGLTVVDSSRFYVSGRDSFYRYKPLTDAYETISENIPSMKARRWMFLQLIEIKSNYYGINLGNEIWRIDTN